MLIKITRFSVQTLTLLSCFLPLLCIKAAHGVNPCEENIYLEVGREGVVSCDFRDFALLGWINGNGNHEETSPFIYLENSQRKGVGYTNGDYDMEPDGSLIIKNVQFRNDVNYTALYVPYIGPQVYFKVPVRVFVRPDPFYPVINGLSKQQYIVQDVMSSGSIECTLNGVTPVVDLEWVYQSDVISIENEDYSKSSNYDGTHNTVMSSRFTIISGSVERVTVKCRTAGELAHLFPSVTTIYLLLERNYPIVNGLVNQPHGVVEMNRRDELSCSMNRVPQDILLQWVLLTEEPSGQLMLQNETSTVNNEDGTANITLTLRFSVLSPFIRRVTLQCRVSGQQADRYPDFTTVDVLISDNFPVVNGHNSGQHVVLRLKREDELNCEMPGVSEDISLEWVVITPDVTDKMVLEDKHSKTTNEDGTFDVRLSRKFSILAKAIHYVTMECRVQSANQYQHVATVAVLITQSHPVINGLTNQQPVLLEIKREDELTCAMNGLSQDVSLEWIIITPDVADGIILEDRISKTSNGDGTFDILLTSNTTIISDSLRRLTLQCQVTGDSAELYPSVTTVELLLSSYREDKHCNISDCTSLLVFPVWLAVILLAFQTLIIMLLGWKSHKRIASMYSMLQKVKRPEGVPLSRRDMNGHVERYDAPYHDDHEEHTVI